MGSGHTWQGRRVLDAAHAGDLDQRAAVLEFGQRVPRDRAEAQAHDEYRREHHLTGAAHHLRGMLAAHASGDRDTAKNHALHYGLHLRALGHDSFAEVPPEVRRRAQASTPDRLHSFKSHPADSFISEHLGKGELVHMDQWRGRAGGQPQISEGPRAFRAGDLVQDVGRRYPGTGRVRGAGVGTDALGRMHRQYSVEWPRQGSDRFDVRDHHWQELEGAQTAPVSKSEEIMGQEQTPSQKLQKFWDDKHTAEEKFNLAKRASVVALDLLLRRLEKGGATGGVAETVAKDELCKKCNQMHKSAAACMSKAEDEKGTCAKCGEPWPCSVRKSPKAYRPPLVAEHVHSDSKKDDGGSKIKKSEKEMRADALRKFWDEKPHRPGFKYVG